MQGRPFVSEWWTVAHVFMQVVPRESYSSRNPIDRLWEWHVLIGVVIKLHLLSSWPQLYIRHRVLFIPNLLAGSDWFSFWDGWDFKMLIDGLVERIQDLRLSQYRETTILPSSSGHVTGRRNCYFKPQLYHYHLRWYLIDHIAKRLVLLMFLSICSLHCLI